MTRIAAMVPERATLAQLFDGIADPAIVIPALVLVISISTALVTGSWQIQGPTTALAILCLAYFCGRTPILGCIVLVFLAVLLEDDAVKLFPTLTQELGIYFYRNWWQF